MQRKGYKRRLCGRKRYVFWKFFFGKTDQVWWNVYFSVSFCVWGAYQHAEEELRKAKTKVESLQMEKEQMDGRLSQSKAKALSLVKDLSTVRERCDELTLESTSAAGEKTRLLETLAVAKKEAADATKQAAAAAAAVSTTSGGRLRNKASSEFTMEQMETQVKVLKSRLACSVCNERDKQVILTRCRHMFCRQCVDKNIKNRSRKCPGCGQRFDMKDVGDIWL
mmetsp:Transcript_10953/g.20883  ORF Transcript_10953/g.20883 Transcript_10953/m.20883 type:complete len:223 (-) Transcript_10953:192-860(-)